MTNKTNKHEIHTFHLPVNRQTRDRAYQWLQSPRQASYSELQAPTSFT